MQRYEPCFLENGYDDVDFMGRDLLSEEDLKEMGVDDEDDLKAIWDKVDKNKSMEVLSKESLLEMSVSEWLSALSLAEQYAETFESNLFGSMEKVEAVWDDELVSNFGEIGKCSKYFCLPDFHLGRREDGAQEADAAERDIGRPRGDEGKVREGGGGRGEVRHCKEAQESGKESGGTCRSGRSSWR